MIQNLLIFYLLWVLGAPAWCFVVNCIAILLQIIKFSMDIKAKQIEKDLDEALERQLNDLFGERDKR